MTMQQQQQHDGDHPPRRRTSASVISANASVDSTTSSRVDDNDDNSKTPSLSRQEAITIKNSSTQRAWLRLSTVLVLATLLLYYRFYASYEQWGRPQSHVGDFLSRPSDAATDEDSLGILLHPEEHRSRDESIITLHWTITSEFRAPDGVRKSVYLINGEFPGPTIEARPGDTLIVHVENALSSPGDGVSIHWHGLHMKGYNNMDGAVGFTQCPILPGRNFTYEFRIGDDQHGTFWYHAHSQVQRGDGLYGGLIIHRSDGRGVVEAERYGYGREMLLLVGDWYHRSAWEMLAWYTSVGGFGNEPVPDSLVINGVGSFNCSMAVPARPLECAQTVAEDLPSMLGNNLVPTRLRVVNTGSIAGLSIGISHAKLTVLQVDGGCEVGGSAADYVGILHPGERVDILIMWDPQVYLTGSHLEILMDPENFNYPSPSLSPNQTFPILVPFPASSPSSIPPLTLPPPALSTSIPAPQHFDLQTALSASTEQVAIPNEADQTILIYTKTQKLAKFSNHPMGFINRTSWSPQSPPLLSLPRTLWDENQLVPHISLLKTLISRDTTQFPKDGAPWIDLIINNLDDGSHPFHLHGHSFHVLATHKSQRGWGSYSPYSSAPSNALPELNLINPPRKDTVSVPRRGYVVVRFRAENEGLWMLHCHVLVHLGSGMAMGLQVGGGPKDDRDDAEDGEGWWMVDEGARLLCV